MPTRRSAAAPRSMSLIRASRSLSIRFCGLMSRCTMPVEWHARSASSTCKAVFWTSFYKSLQQVWGSMPVQAIASRFLGTAAEYLSMASVTPESQARHATSLKINMASVTRSSSKIDPQSQVPRSKAPKSSRRPRLQHDKADGEVGPAWATLQVQGASEQRRLQRVWEVLALHQARQREVALQTHHKSCYSRHSQSA